MKLLRALFSFDGSMGRGAYVAIACLGVLTKHVVDRTIAEHFDRPWDFTNYLVPLGVPISIGGLDPGDVRFLTVMLAVSIPFAWVGLAITTKRFRSIGWPSWLTVLFFVPIANIASFAIAAAWPERTAAPQDRADPWYVRAIPGDRLGAAVFALLTAGVLGSVLVPIGTVVLGSYGWGLFAAIPFVQGAVAAYVYGVHAGRTIRESVVVAVLSIGVTAVALLALALEGAVCIAMAAPIAAVFAAIGAIFACSIGNQRLRPNAAVVLVCVMLAPAIMGAEAGSARVAPVYVVSTTIEVAASPETVWKHVLRFPDLPPPTELPFRAGIAYPLRARIVGHGVGAVRYCQFSTGDFVEPITAWKPNRLLAFSVVKSAEPMRELSPYGHLETPHLHDYMVSRHGEFVLERLPDGGTRLTGKTWHQHHLWPAAYWEIWSDAIVHDIHYRVLRHIKALSEAQQREGLSVRARS